MLQWEAAQGWHRHNGAIFNESFRSNSVLRRRYPSICVSAKAWCSYAKASWQSRGAWACFKIDWRRVDHNHHDIMTRGLHWKHYNREPCGFPCCLKPLTVVDWRLNLTHKRPEVGKNRFNTGLTWVNSGRTEGHWSKMPRSKKGGGRCKQLQNGYWY